MSVTWISCNHVNSWPFLTTQDNLGWFSGYGFTLVAWLPSLQHSTPQTPNVARKLPESCLKDVRKLSESCQNVARMLPESCQKVVRVMRKSWESHDNVMRKSWGSLEKGMRKSIPLLQLQTLQTFLFLSVQLDISHPPNGWPQDHGLPFRQRPW